MGLSLYANWPPDGAYADSRGGQLPNGQIPPVRPALTPRLDAPPGVPLSCECRHIGHSGHFLFVSVFLTICT